MLNNIDRKKCVSCRSCMLSCPRKCITMVEDREGFYYPVVDEIKCIHCNMCIKVCPINLKKNSGYNTYTVCAQNKDESIRSISSAGGVIGAVLKKIFEKKGIVFCVGLPEDNIPKFCKNESLKEAINNKVFSSKYVFVDVDEVFCNVKNCLAQGKLVCFIGLPCQVAGLKAFLQKDYNNLLSIDLTCYGAPSIKVYKKYLQFIEEKFKNKIIDVRFRDKLYGYAAPTFCIELENKKVVSQNSYVKSYLRCFFKNLISKPSCYKCSFKTIDRVSDFTVGDCRSIGKFQKSFDDDKGTTVLYIHTDKGKNILSDMSVEIRSTDVPLSGILKTSGRKMLECANYNPLRENFFLDIDKLTYEELIAKYCPPSKEEYFINIFKEVLRITGLNKLGLMKFLK